MEYVPQRLLTRISLMNYLAIFIFKLRDYKKRTVESSNNICQRVIEVVSHLTYPMQALSQLGLNARNKEKKHVIAYSEFT